MIKRLKLASGAGAFVNPDAIAAVLPGPAGESSVVVGLGFREEAAGGAEEVAALLWPERLGDLRPSEPPPAAGSEAPPA